MATPSSFLLQVFATIAVSTMLVRTATAGRLPSMRAIRAARGTCTSIRTTTVATPTSAVTTGAVCGRWRVDFVFLLRTSAIQVNLIACGLASVENLQCILPPKPRTKMSIFFFRWRHVAQGALSLSWAAQRDMVITVIGRCFSLYVAWQLSYLRQLWQQWTHFLIQDCLILFALFIRI